MSTLISKDERSRQGCVWECKLKILLAFPNTEVPLVDGGSSHGLNCIEKHFLRSVFQLLNNSIDGFSILKEYVIIRVFCFGPGMTLKLICIKSLHYRIYYMSPLVRILQIIRM